MLLVLLLHLQLQAQEMRHVEVSWDFQDDLEGWGNSTAEELMCEVYNRGGELRGAVRDHTRAEAVDNSGALLHSYPELRKFSEPHIDSPPLSVRVVDRHVLVVRMKYTGLARFGRFVLRSGDYSDPVLQRDSSGPGATTRSWSTDTPGFDPSKTREPSTHTTFQIDFEIKGDSVWRNVYVPLWHKFFGTLTQIRLYPALAVSGTELHSARCTDPSYLGLNQCLVPGPLKGDTFSVDWLRIAKAPSIKRVTGCVDKFYPSNKLLVSEAHHNMLFTEHCNNNHHYFTTTEVRPLAEGVFSDGAASYTAEGGQVLPYGTTYDCLREGGQTITLTGTNFGTADATVLVGGRECSNVLHTKPETQVECTLPPMHSTTSASALRVGQRAASAETTHGRERGPGAEEQQGEWVLNDGAADLQVTLTNGQLSGLSDSVPYLSYAVPPPQVALPTLSNIGARSIDISWKFPVNIWDRVTITGFVVYGRIGGVGAFHPYVSVGPVTTTTLIGLEPDTEYEWRVSAVNEDQIHSKEWVELDLYGRRPLLPGALVGAASPVTNLTATLKSDVSFEYFNANMTLNHSAIKNVPPTLGASGVWDGEGHYGLELFGHAHVENCNATHTCCDGYTRWANEDDGQPVRPSAHAPASRTCALAAMACYAGGSISFSPEAGKGASFNGGRAVVKTVAELHALGHRPTMPCGSALRLTPSLPRTSSAAWYPRKLNVNEGFETKFTFRIASPSQFCTEMDDVYTHCRSRGADGFAFVVQNQNGQALGEGGSGMGYAGIANSLAVEFDTWFNEENLEPYENHIAVHSRGFRHPNSANHTYALGASSSVSDLTDGVHTVKLVYSPLFDDSLLFGLGDAFAPTAYASRFFENGDFPNGGMPDWGTGVGTLSVFYDNMQTPVLVVPLNLCTMLRCDTGRAWVGFTAGTGDSMWQTHDILDWTFTSLRRDKEQQARTSPLVNGIGAHSCNDPFDCVHA